MLSMISWWTWAVGIFGLVGVLALAVLLPGAAAILGERFVRVIAAILDTTIGKLALAIAVTWFVSAAYTARNAAEICEARIVVMKDAAEAARLERDRTQGQLSEQDILARVAELEAQTAADKEKLDEFEKAAKTRASPNCGFTPDDFPRSR